MTTFEYDEETWARVATFCSDERIEHRLRIWLEKGVAGFASTIALETTPVVDPAILKARTRVSKCSRDLLNAISQYESISSENSSIPYPNPDISDEEASHNLKNHVSFLAAVMGRTGPPFWGQKNSGAHMPHRDYLCFRVIDAWKFGLGRPIPKKGGNGKGRLLQFLSHSADPIIRHFFGPSECLGWREGEEDASPSAKKMVIKYAAALRDFEEADSAMWWGTTPGHSNRFYWSPD